MIDDRAAAPTGCTGPTLVAPVGNVVKWTVRGHVENRRGTGKRSITHTDSPTHTHTHALEHSERICHARRPNTTPAEY